MIGKFISFEGGEGSGKTTQIKLLHDYLVKSGKECLLTREPASDAIRQLLLTGNADKWHNVSETLLFQASRVEHVETLVKPALKAGKIVLCDRFLDSTIVYQGICKNMGVEYIRQLHQLTLGNFAPDITLILDIDAEIGLHRANSRSGDENRFENLGLEFHKKVRQGFLEIAKKDAGRCMVIDANGDAEEVHKKITANLFANL